MVWSSSTVTNLTFTRDRVIADSSVANALMAQYSQGNQLLLNHEGNPLVDTILGGVKTVFQLPISVLGLSANGSRLWNVCILPWFNNPMFWLEIGLGQGHCSLLELWMSTDPRKRCLSHDEVIAYRISNDSPTKNRDCTNASKDILLRRGVEPEDFLSPN